MIFYHLPLDPPPPDIPPPKPLKPLPLFPLPPPNPPPPKNHGGVPPPPLNFSYARETIKSKNNPNPVKKIIIGIAIKVRPMKNIEITKPIIPPKIPPAHHDFDLARIAIILLELFVARQVLLPFYQPHHLFH